MAERKRSNDGASETEEYTDGIPVPGNAGRSGGDLERQVGSRDEKRQNDGDAGPTRVMKEDEEGEGNLGGHHGTGKPKRDGEDG